MFTLVPGTGHLSCWPGDLIGKSLEIEESLTSDADLAGEGLYSALTNPPYSWHLEPWSLNTTCGELTAPEASLLLLLSRRVMSGSSVTPWAAAPQAPLSLGFPRQEYWSGLPLPSPGDLPAPGITDTSLASQVASLPLSHRRAHRRLGEERRRRRPNVCPVGLAIPSLSPWQPVSPLLPDTRRLSRHFLLLKRGGMGEWP